MFYYLSLSDFFMFLLFWHYEYTIFGPLVSVLEPRPKEIPTLLIEAIFFEALDQGLHVQLEIKRHSTATIKLEQH